MQNQHLAFEWIKLKNKIINIGQGSMKEQSYNNNIWTGCVWTAA